MSQKETDILLLKLSAMGFGVMSLSFALMPAERLGFLAGGLFWAGLLLGGLMQVVLEKRRRNFFARYRVRIQKMQRPRNGLLTFGANRPAKIADCVLVVSIILLILSIILTRGTSYWCYIMIAATTFSFSMHCVLNGRNYFHVINQTKIQQALEQKKVRTFRKERDHNEE